MHVGIIQSVEDLDKIKKQRKGQIRLMLEPGYPSSPALDISSPGSWASGLRPEHYTISPLVLWPLG